MSAYDGLKRVMEPSQEADVSTGDTDFNTRIIEEFRENHGVVGGWFRGTPLVLLHTTGARTGKERVNPLAYMPVDGGIAVFASKGGSPTNPHWYHNLVANPQVTIEIGDETKPAVARVTTGDERDRLFAENVRLHPNFGEYQKKTKRVIPVIVITPQD